MRKKLLVYTITIPSLLLAATFFLYNKTIIANPQPAASRAGDSDTSSKSKRECLYVIIQVAFLSLMQMELVIYHHCEKSKA